MKLLFVGFGTVGQGLAELLLARREQLASEYGLDWQVVGIADSLKGSWLQRASKFLSRLRAFLPGHVRII